MRLLEIDTWKRKAHFEHFQTVDYPHFNLTGNIDITDFLKRLKEKELHFFSSVVYVVSRVLNHSESFKMRIRDGQVVIHDLIHPTFTVLMEDDTYSYCEVKYHEDIKVFNQMCLKQIEECKTSGVLEDEVGRDDYIFITSIPWFSFTSITHPVNMSPVDSVPRISWGKYFTQEGKVLLPFSIQCHHGLVDGLDVGKAFNDIQDLFNTLL